VFAYVLSEKECEKEFPGYGDRIGRMRQVEALKQAVGLAAHDDEIVFAG
jgi:hypothetical protein